MMPNGKKNGYQKMRRSTNVEDVREGSPAKKHRDLYGPGTRMEDLYKGGSEPEGVVRKSRSARLARKQMAAREKRLAGKPV
jgi:hypothetical protein